MEGGKRLKERVKQKKELIPKREYIDNNVIFKINYPSNKLTTRDRINSIIPQFKIFLEIYSKKIKKIDSKFPTLKLDEYDLNGGKNNTFYIYTYTRPFNNHPFLIFGDMSKSYYQILMPLGSEIGQIGTKILEKYLEFLNRIEIIAVAVLLNRTIKIRQVNITQDPRYSLFNCDQIKQCNTKLSEINKMKISSSQKDKIIIQYEKDYRSKAKLVLDHYFELLSDRKFDLAYDYLKGGKSKSSPYFGKTRINTFFYSNHKITGHLEIFIYLFKFMSKLEKLM